MTQPQTMTVDQQEILSRADEVEAPMGTPPNNAPAAPCGLTAAKNAERLQKLGEEQLPKDHIRKI